MEGISMQPRTAKCLSRITLHHWSTFWFGAFLVTVGVVLHLPMYIEARHMSFHMAGMPMDLPMIIGMLLILIGLVVSFLGLYPPSAAVDIHAIALIRVQALDGAPIRHAHVGLLLAMALAVTIDVMKPTARIRRAWHDY
jgi:putative MFS transporter